MPSKRSAAESSDRTEGSIRYDKIPVGKLLVDHRVQRDHLSESKLNRMRNDYDRNALHTLVVSERGNGDMVLLDGQHRWTVVMEIEGEDFPVNCRIHSGLSLAAEAALFVRLNNQGAASPLDLFKARLTQKEPVAVALDKAAANNGWVIGYGPGRIQAVKALEDLYWKGERTYEDYGSELVETTLHVITHVWGNDNGKAVNQNIVKGIGQFLLDVEIFVQDSGKASDFFRVNDLIAAMKATYKTNPESWVSAARGLADGSELTVLQAMGRSLSNTYNKYVGKTRRSAKLPTDVFR